MLAQVFQIWEEKEKSQRKERTYSPGSRSTGTCTLSKMCTVLRSFHSTGISVHWELSGKVPSLVLVAPTSFLSSGSATNKTHWSSSTKSIWFFWKHSSVNSEVPLVGILHNRYP